MVEFAMVIAVFLLMLFGAVSASVYTLERGAAVTAVAAGARVAAGGTEADPNTPNLRAAVPAVARVASPALFGTRVNQVAPGGACRSPEQVPGGEVDACALQTANGMVEVDLRGRPANPAQAAFGLAWRLDVGARIQPVTFRP
jgi:hypothetical protein